MTACPLDGSIRTPQWHDRDLYWHCPWCRETEPEHDPYTTALQRSLDRD